MIIATRPEKLKQSDVGVNKVKKDKNRGFKTAPDGRLIITEDTKRNNNANDDDDDDEESGDDDMDENSILKERKRRTIADDDNEMSDNDIINVKRRRPADADLKSMLSGRTGKSNTSKYTTGGKGIHR